ncbi:hypothetical protein [Marinilabilia salmonicolor]|uniref:hypothetical protein n=1 Tax=Marinilabilia salmonicolor TaxID=989 RepID=UPI00029ACC0F|nr:hypothetical protein [Marinilabilia salmonicolor]
MREQLEIRNIRFILSVLGLVILLLLSPCKVRNSIEAELGVPQTNVLNKSQAAISQSICKTVEISETIQAISEPTVRHPFFPILRTDRGEFTVYFLKDTTTQKPSGTRQPVSEIPLYILHQNLQVYF